MLCVLAACTPSVQVPVRKIVAPPVSAAGLVSPTDQSRIVFTTISEVLNRPLLFSGQMVRLKGQVARVQPPSQSEEVPTIFDLVESADKTVSVKTLKRVEVQDGWAVTVEGRIRIGDPAASSPKDIGITEARLVSAPPQQKRAPPPLQERKAAQKEAMPLSAGSSQSLQKPLQKPLIEEPLLIAPSPLDPPPMSPEEAEERGRIF